MEVLLFHKRICLDVDQVFIILSSGLLSLSFRADAPIGEGSVSLLTAVRGPGKPYFIPYIICRFRSDLECAGGESTVCVDLLDADDLRMARVDVTLTLPVSAARPVVPVAAPTALAANQGRTYLEQRKSMSGRKR